MRHTGNLQHRLRDLRLAIGRPDVWREANHPLRREAGQRVGRHAGIRAAAGDQRRVPQFGMESHGSPFLKHAQHHRPAGAEHLPAAEHGHAGDAKSKARRELLQAGIARHAARVAARAGIAMQQNAAHHARARRHPEFDAAQPFAVNPIVVDAVEAQVAVLAAADFDWQALRAEFRGRHHRVM